MPFLLTYSTCLQPCTMDLGTISRLFVDSSELNIAFDYEGLVTYVDLIRLLKPELTRLKEPKNSPLEHLPIAIHDFLKLSLGLEDEIAKLAWATLRVFAWNSDPEAEDLRKMGRAHLKYMKLFLEHGSSRGLGMY